MSDSKIDTLKQKLLSRLVAGEIDQSEYGRLLGVILQETSTGSSSNETNGGPSAAVHGGSIGDPPTGRRAVLQLDIGASLGKFTLLEQLGRGGMGEVWKAHDPVGDRDVVIKVLPAELSGNPDELARVRDSFRKVHALNHEHICPTYDLGHDEAAGYFLVMQYLNARTLSSYRRAVVKKYGEFPVKTFGAILKKLATALDYSHSHKVIHRDIKPENIMVSRTGKELWLIDFGLAAEIRSSMARVSQVQMDRSGTYPYMAPEQWRGQYQDARTDQYALAVVVYELITGRLPFEGDRFILERCVLNEPFPMIADAADSLNQALAKATAKKRDERFKSCLDFVSAITDTPRVREKLVTSRPAEFEDDASETALRESPRQGNKSNSIGMRFQSISPGTFTMGEGQEAHQVTLTQPYELGVYAVTQEQYEQVVGDNPSHFMGTRHPVENVSWDDAVEFCRILSELPAETEAGFSYRLPTEAEWEYACRAGTTTMFSFGEGESQLEEYAWFKVNSGSSSHPVGEKKPNPWGFYDMHGNIFEWCQDYDGWPDGAAFDPQGPPTGSTRVLRGGSWYSTPRSVRSADRIRDSPDYRYNNVGFRVLRSSIK